MNKKDPKQWKVLKSEYLFKHPWLTARRDHVQLPNGNENANYFVLEYPDWVNVIARTREGQFLLIRQYRHGLQRTCYELVAGVIDPTDTSPEQAAKRELLEETGYSGGNWRLLTTLSGNASTTNNLCHCFVAEGVEKTDHPHLEPTEDIDTVLLSENQVRQLLLTDEIVQSLMAAPLWRYLSTTSSSKNLTAMTITDIIAKRLNLREKQVANTINLLTAGATIPFVSRYRKEATGGLNEVQVAQVKELHTQLEELVHRRNYILLTIEEQGKLTENLRKRIGECWDATLLEDLYLPYKPKRKTRAEAARQKGLEPLANLLMLKPQTQPETAACQFVNTDVPDTDAALQGARDIIAERINEDEHTRQVVRRSFELKAVIRSKVVKAKESDAAKYRDYFDWSEPLKHCSSHRLLAMRRGEAEGFLRVSIAPADEDDCIQRIERLFVKPGTPTATQLTLATTDAYKRLLKPSIETEFAGASKSKADEEAIRVFASNLKQLLLTPPLGQKRIMGIDPGFRTGCKVVCLDAQGNLLHNETIYPHQPQNQYARASFKVSSLAEQYHIEAIAIGNGTAGRETEEMVKSIKLKNVDIFLVSEDGASVYSASKVARDEFPDFDVTVRGAVSIGRRLADPLAELVKIDPKAIGVGQYQHDVDQSELKKSLDLTVESCVNTVGVNLNTASSHLLTYVSGLGPTLAQNIVDYRTANGPFASRKDLLKVPRLGNKAYEQCAGFLRIPNGINPLDNTAVHPERYALVEQMATDAGCNVSTLIASAEIRAKIALEKYCNAEVGMPTLTDIMQELAKPGRDPRGRAKVFSFADNLHTIDDLREGMEVPGVVTNITKFGCFVDMGIKVKGLVHISQMADHFIKDPAEVVHIQQQVMVRVLDIDEERGRIALKLLPS